MQFDLINGLHVPQLYIHILCLQHWFNRIVYNTAKIYIDYNININICMHITHIQGKIEYVDNTVNTEPVRDIYTYSGYVQNYIGNTVDKKPEDLYETYPEQIKVYYIMNANKNKNMKESSYDTLARLWGVRR